MDTHTDRPDGSGGALPTVVTSLPDHDDLVVDDDMTLDGEATANGAAKNGTAAAGDIPVATDHAAQNGHDADGAAAATSADYHFVPALPAAVSGCCSSPRIRSLSKNRNRCRIAESLRATLDDLNPLVSRSAR